MREYEMMMIIDPDIEEEKRREVYEKVENLIKERGGEVININDWGLRELAYPIKRKNSGFYTIWGFRADPGVPVYLKGQLRLIKEIYRVMVLKKENVKSFKSKKEK